MSDVEPLAGWCYICNDEVGPDMAGHIADNHPVVQQKIRGAKISWQHRIDNIIGVLTELKDKPDIDRFDKEVLQELHLVRVRIAQLRGTPVTRVQEGGVDYGSS